MNYTRLISFSGKSKIVKCSIKLYYFLLRFADLYGDQTLMLAEEDMKKFNLWMDGWIEQRHLEISMQMAGN